MGQTWNKNGQTWKKSGRIVHISDYIVRKSDGTIFKIESDYPDFFIVSICSIGSDGLFVLNKRRNYRNFYLWSPSVVQVGDVLTSGNVVFVVEKVEKDDCHIVKFSSSIFIQNPWDPGSELINIQKEQRWFFGSYVHPASCSEIRRIANELMKAFNRRRDDVSIKARIDDNNDEKSFVEPPIKIFARDKDCNNDDESYVEPPIKTIKIYPPFM